MLVSTRHKQLVINARHPAQVQAVIPTAKAFEFRGHTLLAIPHRLEEAQVLNNIGFRAPSPMAFYYDWPGKYTPFEAQRITAAFATLHRRMYILNDMGTGKTNASLWACDYLMKAGAINKVAIFCPLSTMDPTWAQTLFESFPERSYAMVHGTVDKRLKELARDVDFYIINHHGVQVKSLVAELKKRKDIDLIIIDELATFRNSRNDMWKRMNSIVKTRPWVWGMTGTPTPNAPTDAYGQIKLITPGNIPWSYTAFRDMVMRSYGPYDWKPRPDAMDTVYAAMQPAVRFSRDECVDLPPCMYSTRHCEMSPEQAKAYREMQRVLMTEAEGGQITAVNEAVKASKLVQIACGVAYGKNHAEVLFPVPSRINAVREVIEESTGKVIIFVPYTASLDMIATEIAKFTTVEVIDGRVGKNQRDRIFFDFQKAEHPRVLVAQPVAMSHGLTLTEANTIVWYAPPTSNETYQQANGRITRPGQKQKQFIIHFEGTPIERVMYKRLETRGKMQGILLDAFANG